MELFIQDIVEHYNDWTRSDLQAYVEATYPATSNVILNEIDQRLAVNGVGI